MKINWAVRFKSKTFWLTFIPALLLLIQVILATFGVTFEIEMLEINLVSIINALFAVLTILGVVVDPTTKGISDSNRAMMYKEPKEE